MVTGEEREGDITTQRHSLVYFELQVDLTISVIK